MIKREKRGEVFCERCDELTDRGALITINEDKKTFCFDCLPRVVLPRQWPGEGWMETYVSALCVASVTQDNGTPRLL